MKKILINDLPPHQRAAILGGEAAIHGDRTLTRADVETRDERDEREAAEKAQAEAAAHVIEDSLATALAEGRLITSDDRDGMKAEVRNELLGDEDFLAALREDPAAIEKQRADLKAEVRTELLSDEDFLSALREDPAAIVKQRADMKTEVRRELLADEDFLAAVGKLLDKREKAAASSADNAGAPKPETVETLMARTKDELVELAKARGVTHESDANKQAIAEAIVRAGSPTSGGA